MTFPAPARSADLSPRAIAMLRAIEAGRAELTGSREPDLFIDGVPCCDQYTAHVLARQGFVRPARSVPVSARVRAVLTPVGRAAIGTPRSAA